jgi:molybdopterin synthase catalytic subunit
MKNNMKELVIMESPHKDNTFRACEDLMELVLKEIPAEVL